MLQMYVHDNMHLNYSMNRTMVVFFGSFYFYYVSIQCEAMTMCPRPMYPRTKVLGRCNPHCTEIPIYVLPGMKLRGLGLNSNIHVSVSDLYIPRIGPPFWVQPRYPLKNWELVSEGPQVPNPFLQPT
jgi:hypothetical protein